MKWINLFIATIVVLSLVIIPSVSFAQDWPYSPYTYLLENPSLQDPNWYGTENFVFYYWVLPGCQATPIRWKADATIRNDVLVAIQNWTNAVPELTFQEVASGQDIEFKYEATSTGLPSETVYLEHWWMGTQGASYWKRAKARLNPNANWTAAGKRAAIAHEIGHLLGLSDRHGQTPIVCNQVEVTIMDGMVNLLSCDGLQGPSALDEKRVYEFWSQGTGTLSGKGCGTVGTYVWKDLSWSEQWYEFDLFYWNGHTWVGYYSSYHTKDIGVHFFKDGIMLQETVDRQTYGAPAGLHIGCVTPYFPKFNTYGNAQWAYTNL
ncbi:MAG: hypothetical protein FJ004_02595 [Chloroflexi bacterium]|nr:hypothetical protein [Chloroflexota bacterium]